MSYQQPPMPPPAPAAPWQPAGPGPPLPPAGERTVQMDEPQAGQGKPRHRVRRAILATLGGLVLLVAGVAIGAGSNSHQAQLNTDSGKISTDSGKISGLHQQITGLQSSLATARNQAANAVATAKRQVQATYAAKEAALQSKEATVAADQKTLNTELGNVQANTISASGVYVVGQNIKSGTWYTSGDGGQNSNACYDAVLTGSNTSDVSDISSNNNFDGSETVDLSGMYGIQISGPCTWVLQP